MYEISVSLLGCGVSFSDTQMVYELKIKEYLDLIVIVN